jgi:hypothetical protein
MQTYIIRGGASFVLPNGTRLSGGDEIELEGDVAAAHADKIEPLPPIGVDLDLTAPEA